MPIAITPPLAPVAKTLVMPQVSTPEQKRKIICFSGTLDYTGKLESRLGIY